MLSLLPVCYPGVISFIFYLREIAMSSVSIEILRSARDARGYVFEPLDGAALGGYGNVHVVYSIPGAVRGNHYHVAGTEAGSGEISRGGTSNDAACTGSRSMAIYLSTGRVARVP